MILVLDASVAVKWFVAEEHTDKAFEILEDILNDPTKYAVPELFFFELNHVIYKVLGSYSKEHKQLLDILANIGFSRFSITPEYLEEIHRFQKMGISGYDASYLGLAALLKGKWITFDETAHKKVAKLGISKLLSK
jgi:predicted nucleic acid-binding protein